MTLDDTIKIMDAPVPVYRSIVLRKEGTEDQTRKRRRWGAGGYTLRATLPAKPGKILDLEDSFTL